ncbi:MAG: prepilin-type N-terminal cleavage/methylation domain-containing protein [Candidatus Cloacimonadota bacterium]|nr:MAG: prepilin-type N-terminal cleavage/methylation domain-containing protein [Candidatus Cloacimonadota bacterium]
MRELLNKRKRMAIKRKKREDGFTLIEVLVTIMVLAVVLIALFSCFLYGFTVISRMRQTAIVTQCIQEELELIRNMPFNNILSLDSSFENESLSLLEDSSGILSLEDSGGDDIKKLTVSVIWSYNGRQMRRDIVTFVTRKGINKR